MNWQGMGECEWIHLGMPYTGPEYLLAGSPYPGDVGRAAADRVRDSGVVVSPARVKTPAMSRWRWVLCQQLRCWADRAENAPVASVLEFRVSLWSATTWLRILDWVAGD